MELEIAIQRERVDEENIFNTALLLYYNPSIPSHVFGEMTESLLNSIVVHQCSDTMERGIIVTLGFFVDKGFKVVCAKNDLNLDTISPGIPYGWRNTIRGVVDTNYQLAIYYLKCTTIRFKLTFSFNGTSVHVEVYYTAKQAGYSLSLSQQRLDGLLDLNIEHRRLYANSILDLLSKKYLKVVINKALNHESPSDAPSPVFVLKD